MQYIDELPIENKRVLLRVDYNISLNPDHSIANDERIHQSLPTIQLLLKNNNKLILVAHLGRPKERSKEFSLQIVADDLQKYLPNNKVILVDDFLKNSDVIQRASNTDVLLLENIRFYPGEETNDPEFAKQLASLADVYVNDAFGVSHRAAASIVGITQFLPSYGGLLLKKEVTMLSRVTEHPEKPFVAILAGSKISTKIKLITKLVTLADTVILGGGLANTFLGGQGQPVGKSVCEPAEFVLAKELTGLAAKHNTQLLVPLDVITATSLDASSGEEKRASAVADNEMIVDIGPETEAEIEKVLLAAKLIVWNGPVGYFENPAFRRGTDFLYYAITENSTATSIVGGGETLAAVTKKEHLEKITHISTGGGAMLEFIENGTLPGIEALNNTKPL